jgi:putative DNA primase/helicase
LAHGILPPNVVSSIAPDQFSDKDCRVDLAGKQLNISDELGTSKAISSDKFKNVTTGGRQTTHKKYRTAMSFTPIAQHTFACNDLPSFQGGFDRRVFRRLLVISFDRVIPADDQIPMLAEKILRAEMDLLMAWAIDGAKRLLENEAFTIPPSAIKALDDWSEMSDPVVGWVQERVVANGLGLKDVKGAVPEVTTRDAFADFEDWYVDEKFDPKRQPQIRNFVQRVTSLGLPHVLGFALEDLKAKWIGSGLFRGEVD